MLTMKLGGKAGGLDMLRASRGRCGFHSGCFSSVGSSSGVTPAASASLSRGSSPSLQARYIAWSALHQSGHLSSGQESNAGPFMGRRRQAVGHRAKQAENACREPWQRRRTWRRVAAAERPWRSAPGPAAPSRAPALQLQDMRLQNTHSQRWRQQQQQLSIVRKSSGIHSRHIDQSHRHGEVVSSPRRPRRQRHLRAAAAGRVAPPAAPHPVPTPRRREIGSPSAQREREDRN